MIQTTHSILASYIYKGHQPASMGSRRVVSSMAYLNKALEHLEERKKKEQHIRSDTSLKKSELLYLG